MTIYNAPEEGDAILNFFNRVVRDLQEMHAPLDENFSGFYPTDDGIQLAG
jgi:hypothetical protein